MPKQGIGFRVSGSGFRVHVPKEGRLGPQNMSYIGTLGPEYGIVRWMDTWGSD